MQTLKKKLEITDASLSHLLFFFYQILLHKLSIAFTQWWDFTDWAWEKPFASHVQSSHNLSLTPFFFFAISICRFRSLLRSLLWFPLLNLSLFPLSLFRGMKLINSILSHFFFVFSCSIQSPKIHFMHWKIYNINIKSFVLHWFHLQA